MAAVVDKPSLQVPCSGVPAKPEVRTPNTGRKFVCRCLRVTEQDVRDAMAAHVACDLVDLMKHTGAGTGCMACRANIRKIVATCECDDCDS